MDEATAHLDPESEAYIIDQVYERKQFRTTVMVVQKILLIDLCHLLRAINIRCRIDEFIFGRHVQPDLKTMIQSALVI